MSKIKSNILQYKTEIRNGFEVIEPGNHGIIETKKLNEFTKAMNTKKKYPFIYNSINSLTAQKREENEDNIAVDEYISFFNDELSDSKTKEGQKKLFSVFCEDNPNSFSWTKFALTARDLGDNEMANKLLKLIEQSKVYIKDINFKEFASILNEDYKKEMRNRSDSEDYGEKESYKERKKKKKKVEEDEDMVTISSGKNEEIRNDDGEKSNKRYHRRYRDNKTKGDNNENGNGNGNKVYSKYRKKH